MGIILLMLDSIIILIILYSSLIDHIFQIQNYKFFIFKFYIIINKIMLIKFIYLLLQIHF